jgi:hypothetical protein
MNPLRVCIVGLKCYDHVAPKPVPRYLGGIETQLTILAKGLSREGCHVSLITYDHGQSDRERLDGVTVLKSYAPETGVRGIRAIARMFKLWAAMRGQSRCICKWVPGLRPVTSRSVSTISPRRRFVFRSQ